MHRSLALLPLFAALSGCTYRIHESNIVIPRVAGTADTAALRAEFPSHAVEEVRIASGNGASLYSVVLRHPEALATVVYFGGNGYTVARWAARTSRIYARHPVNLLIVDHRGYGASTGTPGIDALFADALAVHDHLRDDPVLGRVPLVVHGHSLGSFMAGHVAAHRRLGGLVLEGSVGRVEDWTAHLRSRQPLWQRMLVWRVVPTGALAGRGNAAAAAAMDEPVIYLVGARDDVTPAAFSRALYDATPLPAGEKQLVVAHEAGHMAAAESPEFAAAVKALLRRIEEDAGHAGPAGTAHQTRSSGT